jgi:hypothetical protein
MARRLLSATVAPRDSLGQEVRDFMDIEELHRVVVQGFASVNARFDSVDARLAAVDERLTAELAAVDEKVDSGFASVNQRIDALQVHMDAEFGRVKDALMEHGRQLKDIRAALDRKVDRDELEARH